MRKKSIAHLILVFPKLRRCRDAKEIDVVIEGDGKLCPLEIKKTAAPDKRIIKTFSVVLKTGNEMLPQKNKPPC